MLSMEQTEEVVINHYALLLETLFIINKLQMGLI